MKLDEIRHRLRNGFRPFALCLTNGEQIQVRRPFTLAVGKNIVVAPDERGLLRRIERKQIMSVRDLPEPRRKH